MHDHKMGAFIDCCVRLHVGRGAVLAAIAVTGWASCAPAQTFVNRVLTDNICCEEPHTDRHLAKAWGLEFDPAGSAWVAANFAGRAEVLDGDGKPLGLSVQLEIPPLFNGGFVTGLAFNAGAGFLIPDSTGTPASPRFLFVTQEGTILGWTPRPAPEPQNTFAPIIQNNFDHGDRYTGVAMARTAAGDRLYIADIAHKRIKVLDASFAPVDVAFTDPALPAGYAPFNVCVLGGRVYVAYGVQNEDALDAAPGPGAGIISRFSLDGEFESRLVSHGALNAPWGMAIAPENFGAFSGALLVGNFGDGRINGFDPNTGAFIGALRDGSGQPIAIDGLHGIEFGNGLPTQANNTLYYASAPAFGVVGVFGRVDQRCKADINRDGQVTVQDVFDFLGAWFVPSARADITGDNAVSVQDILDVLAGYFGGCV